VPPSSASEVIQIQGAQSLFNVIGDRLEPDLAKQRTGQLLRFCPKVWMGSQEPAQNCMGLAGF
jgi:hypothetical protein